MAVVVTTRSCVELDSTFNSYPSARRKVAHLPRLVHDGGFEVVCPRGSRRAPGISSAANACGRCEDAFEAVRMGDVTNAR
jgi:hypothetical protein